MHLPAIEMDGVRNKAGDIHGFGVASASPSAVRLFELPPVRIQSSLPQPCMGSRGLAENVEGTLDFFEEFAAGLVVARAFFARKVRQRLVGFEKARLVGQQPFQKPLAAAPWRCPNRECWGRK